MNLRLKLVLLSVTLIISIVIFLAMRRGTVRGGFVLLWMMICALIVSVPLFESQYRTLANAIGLNFAIDMIYIMSILFLMSYVFYLTAKYQRAHDALQIIVARLAILESRVDRMDKSSK